MQKIAWQRQYLSVFDALQSNSETEQRQRNFRFCCGRVHVALVWQTMEKRRKNDNDVHEQIVTTIQMCSKHRFKKFRCLSNRNASRQNGIVHHLLYRTWPKHNSEIGWSFFDFLFFLATGSKREKIKTLFFIYFVVVAHALAMLLFYQWYQHIGWFLVRFILTALAKRKLRL